MDPSTWLIPATLNNVVRCKILYFFNNEELEVFGYKTLWGTNTVASYKENKSLGPISICDGS